MTILRVLASSAVFLVLVLQESEGVISSGKSLFT